MSYTDYLYILTSSNQWLIVNSKDPKNKYYDTYTFIKETLDKWQFKGKKAEEAKFDIHYNMSGVATKILKIESHRYCNVAFCQQYDFTTDGLRYIVYGTRYNENNDHGIGVSLIDITNKYADKYCPNIITTKYI